MAESGKKSVIDLDGVLQNENATVHITLPRGKGKEEKSYLKAFLIEDFTIAAGNSFQAAIDTSTLASFSQQLSLMRMASAEVGKIMEGASDMTIAGFDVGKYLGSAGGFMKRIGQGAQISLQTVEYTQLSWIGSEKPTFRLPLIFVATDPMTDVRKVAAKLYQAVFPTGTAFIKFGKKGQYRAGMLKAPFNYFPAGSWAGGTFTFHIGSWFSARWQVIKDVSFTFSSESILLKDVDGVSTGKFAPLYAKGDISFEPFRAITFEEFLQYIKIDGGDLK